MGRKNQAYFYLKNQILNDEIPQGSPLREMEIAAALNMSRTPVREALRELEAEGVIISYPSRGTFVTTITPYDVEEIGELRILSEVWALEKGFSRISVDEIDAMINAFKAASDPFDWQKYHEVDRAFHQMIIDKSGSKRLAGFVETLNTQIERIRRYGAKDTSRANFTLTEHLVILNCMREKDLPGARRALKNHLQSVSSSAIEWCRSMNCQRK